MPPPPTPRLRFRAWSPDLRPDFAALARDPRVVRHIPPGTPWPDERIDEFVARQMRHELERGHSMWWIGRADTAATPVGFCGLQPVPDGSHVEIGWWLRPEQQGQGFASEAARAVLDWAWQATALPAVLAHTTAANAESLRVMERIGMQRLGVFPAAAQGRPGLAIELTVYRAERPR